MTPRLLPLLLALLFAVPAVNAQDRPDRDDRSAERIETLSQDARRVATDLVSDSDRDRVERVADLLEYASDHVLEGNLADARDLLDEAEDLLDEVADDLRDDGYDGRADRLQRLGRSIQAEEDALRGRRRDGVLREGRYRDGRRIDDDDWEDRADRIAERAEEHAERIADRAEERAERLEEAAEEWAERWEDRFEDRWDGEWEWRRDRDRDDWRRRRSRFRSYAPSFVGDFNNRWPYNETAAYRPVPSLRYNRVDGLTLGARRQPLEWDSYDRARAFGQLSYAFGLDEWRYEAGGEARLGHSYRSNDFDIKVGGAYRRETATDDLWKAGWAENTTAAFFFRTDFFDYFQTEGYTLYSVMRLTPALQATVAYRSDDYLSLRRNATWALFGGNDFRLNPRVDEGRMQSMVVTLDGGKIRGLRWIPSGIAFRAEAEFGQDFGGDFSFNRYTGDVRAYIRAGRDTGLALRFRGATSEGALPRQKMMTIGGAGSVRAYPQNSFRGSSMLLANAELTFYNVDMFDDILHDMALFALVDAGWVDGPTQKEFDINDVIPATGFGLALADRQVRFEIAWPLRDLGTGLEPTVWLRLNPTF